MGKIQTGETLCGISIGIQNCSRSASRSSFSSLIGCTSNYIVGPASDGSSSLNAFTLSPSPLAKVKLVAPQYAMVSIPISVSLMIPADVTLTSVSWDYGDASTSDQGIGPQNHTYFNAGNVTLTVSLSDDQQNSTILSQVIHVLPYDEGSICVSAIDAECSRPGQCWRRRVAMSAGIPPCVQEVLQSITWDFWRRHQASASLLCKRRSHLFHKRSLHSPSESPESGCEEFDFECAHFGVGDQSVTNSGTPSPTSSPSLSPSPSVSPEPSPTPTPTPSVSPFSVTHSSSLFYHSEARKNRRFALSRMEI